MAQPPVATVKIAGQPERAFGGLVGALVAWLAAHADEFEGQDYGHLAVDFSPTAIAVKVTRYWPKLPRTGA